MLSMILGVIGSTLMALSGATEKAPVKTVTNPLHCVRVTDVGGRLVNGCYDVSRFVEQNGGLWAVCKLKGTLDGVDIDEDCYVPITIGSCDGGSIPRLNGAPVTDCTCFVIHFGGCGTIPRLVGSLELNPTDQSCTPADYPADRICNIVTACNSVGTPRIVVASLLNDLLL